MAADDDDSCAPDRFAGLDAIAWHELRHVFGSASDVPGLLRTALDPEDGADAVDTLSDRLYHQGGCVGDAATAALPFVIGLAGDTAIARRTRQEALLLLGLLAQTAADLGPDGVDAGWASAWAASLPVLLGLLSADDPVIRLDAQFPLSSAVAHAGPVLTALRDRWTVEPDPVVRSGLILSAGDLLVAAAPPAVPDDATPLPASSDITTPSAVPADSARVTAAPEGTSPSASTAGAGRWLAGLREGADPHERVAAVLALAGRDRLSDGELLELTDALRAEEPTPWARSQLDRPTPINAIAWACARLGDDTAARAAVATALLDHPRPGHRYGAIHQAAEVVTQWRSPAAALLPRVAERVADTDPTVRRVAVSLLAAVGPQARPWADRLAGAMADSDGATANGALFALTRMDDERGIDALENRLARPDIGFADHGNASFGWTRPGEPGIVDVLAPLHRHSVRLLPALREHLRAGSRSQVRSSGSDAGATPVSGAGRGGGHHGAIAAALAHWGPLAAPAAGELDALLDTGSAAHALRALVAIGPPADAATAARVRAALERLAGDRSVLPIDRARAHLRLLRDPGAALAVADTLLADRYAQSSALEVLAEMGPGAAHRLPQVRALRPEADWSWRGLGIGWALWHLGGDPAEAVPVLVDVVRPLGEGRFHGAAQVRAIERLGEIGAPAVAAAPFLHAVLSAERRPGAGGRDGWRAIADDLALCAAARTALKRIAPGTAT